MAPNQSLDENPWGLAGRAFVAIWHDIAPEGLETFYAWHDREHMPERLAIPGFRRGRRYIRIEGEGQQFFNLYEVESFDVLVGPDYLARLNSPTPWTQRTVTHFRNVARGLCRVARSTGTGQGGCIATVRFAPAPGAEDALQRHVNESALPAVAGRPGVLGVHWGITDETGSTVRTAEQLARANPTDIPRWVAMVEGISCSHLRRALEGTLDAVVLKSNGATGPVMIATYQLEAERSG